MTKAKYIKQLEEELNIYKALLFTLIEVGEDTTKEDRFNEIIDHIKYILNKDNEYKEGIKQKIKGSKDWNKKDYEIR